MRWLALLLPLALLRPASAQEDDDVRALEARIAALERENEALRKQLEWLRRLDPRLDRTGKQTAVIRIGGKPDDDHLEGISLAADATREQAKSYVARILRAASQRGAYGPTDPEVDLLVRLGPSHVDVLIEPLVYAGGLDGDTYLVEALKVLAGEAHKELVLGSLRHARDLVQVVRERGWTEEAAPILIEVLANRDSWRHRTLPSEWIEAVAGLKRPESYGVLKGYFYYGFNRYHTWNAIKDLPGLELKAEVDTLWPWARERDDNWVRLNVAAVAAHYGHLDALGVLFEEPDQWPQWDVITAVTPYHGRRDRVEQAKEWFRTHKNHLEFDAARGRYLVAGEISQR